MSTLHLSQNFIKDIENAPSEFILEQLERTGLVLFSLDDASGEKLLRLASKIGEIHKHPDADQLGITSIAVNEAEAANGKLGFSDKKLFPHTDASSIGTPPRFLLNLCTVISQTGGESLLTDMRSIYEQLIKEDPSAAAVLTHPGSAIFGTPPRAYIGSIFEETDRGISCRFRLDAAGFFAGNTLEVIAKLISKIHTQTEVYQLLPGEGYLLDNSWWLHGRNAFDGNREVLRVLANPRTMVTRNVASLLAAARN